jgi:glycerol-3-phosphate acyltransferase PlsY
MEPQLLAVFAMSALLVFRHSKNISNLIAGKESRIGGNSKDAAKRKGK